MQAGIPVDEHSHVMVSGLAGPAVTVPCRGAHDLLRRLAHRVGGREVQAAVLQHLLALLDVGAFHPDDDRDRDAELLDRGDDAFGEHVAAQDAAEDVDQDGLDALVGHQDLEGVPDLLGVGAAADVEEVRRLAARQLDDVHRRHREARRR